MTAGELPTGTVTFLFTDIEGSTQRWQRDPAAMSALLARHDGDIRAAVSTHGGVVFKHTGDGMCAVFTSASAAVAAALDAQTHLELPVRMGIHTGEAEARDGDYFGPTLNRTARVMDAGHGGQLLLSAATAHLAHRVDLVDLGAHELKGLDVPEQIFQVGDRTFPALRTPRQGHGNLPAEISNFVGRSQEQEQLSAALREQRLVTLIGVGGTGKTRLALETAAAATERYADGCWFVGLAAVNDESMVPLAVASGLQVTVGQDRDVVDDLVSRLAHKQMLIVMDNCEHVLAAAADVAAGILSGCPRVGILATSREPLMVAGEQLVPLGSLPPADAEQLFWDRARAEAPDLIPDEEQVRAVGELCTRLDGLPLALELAASRIRAFSPVELVDNLQERFRLLVGGRRSKVERHQTMRGALDWSYDLCTPREQVVFDRLAVFPAGFDLNAARAVASGDDVVSTDVVDIVSQLLDRSLLQRTMAPDGTTRYRMLETMRAYGREHLQHSDAADATRSRHARYIAATVAAMSLRALGPDENTVVGRLNEYVPDAFLALEWCIDHEEWDLGMSVVAAGAYGAEREEQEMIARLHDAGRAGGASAALLDELARVDTRDRSTVRQSDSAERGWRDLRSARAIPSRRCHAPFIDFNDGGLQPEDVDEYLECLSRWRETPPLVRFYAEWSGLRSLVNNGYLDRAAALLPDFGSFTEELHSRRASRSFADLSGRLARERGEWAQALRWYEIARGDGPLRTWFDLVVAWHLIALRALAGDIRSITGSELRDTWRCYQDEHLIVLRYHGAISTAVALDRLRHRELGLRFIACCYRDADDSVRAMFGSVFEAAGLPTDPDVPVTDLETLLAELSQVADELDALS